MSQNAPEDLFMHLHALGLRRPSEPTAQAMAVGLLLSSEGLEKSLALTMASRTQMVKTTKSWFLKSCNGLRAPAEWCWQLPPTPAKLQHLHPSLYAAGFAKGPPVACKLDMLQVETLRMQTPMRAPKGGAAGGCFMSLQRAPTPTPAAQDMATMLFSFLQQAMNGGKGLADKPVGLKLLEPRFARSGSQLELPSHEPPPNSPTPPFKRLGSQGALSSFETPPTKQPIAASHTSFLAKSSANENPSPSVPEPLALEDLAGTGKNKNKLFKQKKPFFVFLFSCVLLLLFLFFSFLSVLFFVLVVSVFS